MADYLDELVQKITTKADLKGFDDLEKKQKKAEKNSKKLGETSGKAFDEIERGTDRAKQSLDRYERGLRRANKSANMFGKFLRRTIGYYFGIQGIRSVIQTYTKLDDLQRVLNGISGGAEEGAKQFAYLKKEAFRTATDIDVVANAYKNFYSAAKGAGFSMQQAQGIFSSILTAGRGIGASQQQIGGALTALEQMLSKGKVSAEELRRQLGNALPGAVQIAAKAMGVLPAQFEEMMQKGIAANEFVQKFAIQAEKDLGENLSENVRSLGSELTNLGTAWKLLIYETMKEGGTGESLAKAIREITKLLVSPEIKKAMDLIGKGLTFVIKHIKLILLLFGIKKIYDIIRALKALHWAIWDIATTTGKATAATQALSTAYAMLTSGQIIGGLKLLTKSLWAMCAPLLKVSAILAGVVSWFMILQDLWLTFADKDADTITRRFMGSGVEVQNLFTNPLKDLSPMQQTQMTIKDAAIPYLQELISTFNPARNLDFFTGGAAPVSNLYDPINTDIAEPLNSNIIPINPEIPIPDRGYVGSLPNLNGSYNNSDTKSLNNNFTINIYPSNSQPETIATSVEDALNSFFTKYNMGYA